MRDPQPSPAPEQCVTGLDMEGEGRYPTRAFLATYAVDTGA
jgi:hypothetical protein